MAGQAARLGARLHLVLTEPARAGLLAAFAQAALRQQYTPGYLAELAIWTGRYSDARDGMPRESVQRWAYRDSPWLRRVPLGRLSAHPHHPEPDAEAAAFTVLTTTEDGTIDRLRAGEAASAVLLAATRAGLASTPLSQALEIEHTRRQVAEEVLGVPDHPQLVVRTGWAPEGAGDPPATPRRPLRFMLLPG